MTVTELLVLFLEDAQATNDNDTFRDYLRWCTAFAKEYGNRQVCGLTRADATDFKLKPIRRPTSPASRNTNVQ